MQLVATGAQDLTLNKNPEITFFQLRHRSYSNFATESIEQTVCGSAGFGKTISCTISRNGDLINRMYVEVHLDNFVKTAAGNSLINNFGRHMIEYADIEIGGQRIDRHYGKWLHIWNELSHDKHHKAGDDRMVGNRPELTEASKGTDVPATSIIVPLQFWFCRHPGLALPLIALQYHEVKLQIKFAESSKLTRQWTAAGDTSAEYWKPNLATPLPVKVGEVQIWVDYVYLDNEERRRMATGTHSYLIDQLQHSGETTIGSITGTLSTRLNFNHPVKELVWTVNSVMNSPGVYSYPSPENIAAKTSAITTTGEDLFTAVKLNGVSPVKSATLKLNGHERFKERDGTYFDSVQPCQHHTNTPENPGIHVYSFGLKPEEYQPSGTCNFSRIDNAILSVDFVNEEGVYPKDADFFTSATLDVWAVNYNQLRIMSGMGGLTYSN